MSTSASAGFAASLICTEDDPRSFCRRVAAVVNPSAMHLARAFVLAAQVYPVRTDTMHGTATVMRCEFRMRQSGAPADAMVVADVRARLGGFEMFDVRMLDADTSALDDQLVA